MASYIIYVVEYKWQIQEFIATCPGADWTLAQIANPGQHVGQRAHRSWRGFAIRVSGKTE